MPLSGKSRVVVDLASKESQVYDASSNGWFSAGRVRVAPVVGVKHVSFSLLSCIGVEFLCVRCKRRRTLWRMVAGAAAKLCSRAVI
jgi:hypothetical protein